MNKKIDTTNWRPFAISDFFVMNAGKYYAKDDYQEGEIPLVSSSDQDNGIMAFTDLEPKFTDGITIGKVNMSVFYQERPFCVSSDVTVLSSKEKMSKKINLFFVTLLLCERYRFNYGNQIRLNDTLKLKVKLPVKNNMPDWDFMEKFIDTHIKDYSYVAKPAKNFLTPKLDAKDWQYYTLGELFTIKKGKRLTTADQSNGKFPYISSSGINNGMDAFISNGYTDENCLSFACYGTIGEVFYQKQKSWISDNCNVLYLKNKSITGEIALFLTTILKKEKYRFSYGVTAKMSRLQNFKIKLPTKQNQPDWDFMTNFIQSLPFSSQI